MSYNVTFTGSENLELLGITLHNGNSNHLCLCTLYSPPATTHLVTATAVYFCYRILALLYTSYPLYHSLHDILSSFNLLQVVQEPTQTNLYGLIGRLSNVIRWFPNSEVLKDRLWTGKDLRQSLLLSLHDPYTLPLFLKRQSRMNLVEELYVPWLHDGKQLVFDKLKANVLNHFFPVVLIPLFHLFP